MISATAWNWGAKSAFFWLGTCTACFVWCFFRLPETGGFTFAELDILFANKVSARKFTHVQVEGESTRGASHTKSATAIDCLSLSQRTGAADEIQTQHPTGDLLNTLEHKGDTNHDEFLEK